MNTLNSPAVEEAMQELKRISAEEDERYRALARSHASAPSVTLSPIATPRGARVWRKADWKAR